MRERGLEYAVGAHLCVRPLLSLSEWETVEIAVRADTQVGHTMLLPVRERGLKYAVGAHLCVRPLLSLSERETVEIAVRADTQVGPYDVTPNCV